MGLAAAGKYSKFIVSLLGTATVGLTTWFPNAQWETLVASALSALAVYLIPNQAAVALPSSPAPPAPPVLSAVA